MRDRKDKRRTGVNTAKADDEGGQPREFQAREVHTDRSTRYREASTGLTGRGGTAPVVTVMFLVEHVCFRSNMLPLLPFSCHLQPSLLRIVVPNFSVYFSGIHETAVKQSELRLPSCNHSSPSRQSVVTCTNPVPFSPLFHQVLLQHGHSLGVARRVSARFCEGRGFLLITKTSCTHSRQAENETRACAGVLDNTERQESDPPTARVCHWVGTGHMCATLLCNPLHRNAMIARRSSIHTLCELNASGSAISPSLSTMPHSPGETSPLQRTGRRGPCPSNRPRKLLARLRPFPQEHPRFQPPAFSTRVGGYFVPTFGRTTIERLEGKDTCMASVLTKGSRACHARTRDGVDRRAKRGRANRAKYGRLSLDTTTAPCLLVPAKNTGLEINFSTPDKWATFQLYTTRASQSKAPVKTSPWGWCSCFSTLEHQHVSHLSWRIGMPSYLPSDALLVAGFGQLRGNYSGVAHRVLFGRKQRAHIKMKMRVLEGWNRALMHRPSRRVADDIKL